MFCRDPEPVIFANSEMDVPDITVSEEKYDIPLEDFFARVEEEPKAKGSFRMVASGNLALKTEELVFDGFRMVLIPSDTEFRPKYDIIDCGMYIQVILDLPGLEVKDGEYIGGDFSYKVKNGRLAITGKRALQYLHYYNAASEPNPTVDYCDETQHLKNKRAREKPIRQDVMYRQSSEGFKIIINLPKDVKDDAGQSGYNLRAGVMYITLMKKIATPPPDTPSS